MRIAALSKWAIAAIGLVLVVACIYPPSRHWLQNFLAPESGREVLATAEGDLLNTGKIVKVIKYRGPEGIFVEIVDNDPEHTDLIAKIVIPDKRDGLFNLHGRVTRLAIADFDNDGANELLVPTFDDQLVPHLNIYRYNPQSRQFDSVKPP